MRKVVSIKWLLAFVAIATSLGAQAPSGRLIADTVHSKALEENRFGDPADRSLLVYLPPSYASATDRRYPVIYLLHGYGGTERTWLTYRGFHPQRSTDSLIAAGAVREMIIVMPNGNNRLGGSFYTNSVSTGGWEEFIARELVDYIDGKYRTIARAESRGLAGHSMGGFGTFAVGFRHAAQRYTGLYAMSACCTRFSGMMRPSMAWDSIGRLTTIDQSRQLSFIGRVNLALAAAFAPNPKLPPLYADLPFRRDSSGFKTDSSAIRRWVEHSIYDMIPARAASLNALKGLVFDIGLSDELVPPSGLMQLDSALTRAGVAHRFETYAGTHSSGIGDRMVQRVLPFFSGVLSFEQRR